MKFIFSNRKWDQNKKIEYLPTKLNDMNPIRTLLRPHKSVIIPPAIQPKICPTTRILAKSKEKFSF